MRERERERGRSTYHCDISPSPSLSLSLSLVFVLFFFFPFSSQSSPHLTLRIPEEVRIRASRQSEVPRNAFNAHSVVSNNSRASCQTFKVRHKVGVACTEQTKMNVL